MKKAKLKTISIDKSKIVLLDLLMLLEIEKQIEPVAADDK